MLYLIKAGPRLDDGLAASNPLYPRMFNAWLDWHDQAIPRMILADDPENPTAALGGISREFFVLGDQQRYPAMLADLAAGRIEPASAWPDAHVQAHWEKKGMKHPVIKLESHGWACHEAALAQGYAILKLQDDGQGAYYIYFEGAPRFSHLVKHQCRIVEGLELFELMCQGTDYDESGTYTRSCLELGPSFVCEVDGRPVCWSCTHICRAMGMIYTPPEHRRRGYALSLAAFQVDHMLAMDGLAWCAVLGNNTPSLELLDSMGASRLEQRIYQGHYQLPANSVVRI